MSARAAILLLQDDKIALIERHRAGLHYFSFPGGHIEAGETPEQAAIREAKEELGLDVSIRRLVVTAEWNGRTQFFFLAELIGGTFGSGTGEEMNHPKPEKGSYQPVWVPVSELPELPVKPPEMAMLLDQYLKKGWPEKPGRFYE